MPQTISKINDDFQEFNQFRFFKIITLYLIIWYAESTTTHMYTKLSIIGLDLNKNIKL